MTQIVVDTDLVSFLFKNHPIGRHYDPEVAGCVALISFMTVAQVERSAALRGLRPGRGVCHSAPTMIRIVN
jgi:hypothetical protein